VGHDPALSFAEEANCPPAPRFARFLTAMRSTYRLLVGGYSPDTIQKMK